VRASLITAALLAAAALPDFARAQTVERSVTADAQSRSEQAREKDMGAMGHHERTFTFVQIEADYGDNDGVDHATWDIDAWIGGDRNKLWLKSEGEAEDGELEQAELQVLYSRNIWTFFDAQIGLRQDFEPSGTTYLAGGVQGLAPYLLETDLTGFVSDDGDVSVRFEQTLDVLLTQRLILEPHLETNLQFQDVPERELGAGFTDIEAGLQLRYEITRKLAPYLDVEYARALGETAALRRAAGEEIGGWAVRAGLRSWF
jgi:copper resistance protein B